MPSASQPPKRSWRDDASGGRGGSTKREWQKEPGKGGGGPWFTKRVKILLAATSLLAVVIGAVIVLLLLRHEDPPRLVLIGAGYETNLAVPQNACGENGLRDLKEWADDHKSRHGGDPKRSITAVPETLTVENDPFKHALDGCTADKVVVFVSVHGGASAGQGAYLIPDDTNPRDGYPSYPMSKALAALENLPKPTKKLLILDTTQVNADWNLGLLHNDFVRSTLNDPRVKNIPNLIVLFASDEGQRSWVSEEYGRTIFAHYVVQGLKGAAKTNDNGMLTADELIGYVQRKVESWVRHNRGDVQTPKLYDPNNLAKDMELVQVEKIEDKDPEEAQVPTYTPPEELVAAWKQRDELANAFPHPTTYTPHLWRQYHDSLLRYEQLLRVRDNDHAAKVADDIAKLVSRIRQSQKLEYDVLAATLSTPTAMGWSLPDKDDQKLRDQFNALWDDPTAKPEAFGEMLKEWRNTVSTSAVKHLGRLRVVALLLERARRSDKEADFKRVCDILPQVDDAMPPRRPAEAHYALMMQNYVPDSGRDWPRMRASLVTRLHAEQAALGLPRTADDGPLPATFTPYSEQLRPWLDKSVESADTARRGRENLLFASATESTRLGARLDDADKLYGDIQGRAKEVQAALQRRDRVLADLPYYSQWLARQATTSSAEEKTCLDTWDAVHELGRLLNNPGPDKIDGLREPLKEIHFDEIAATFKAAYLVNDKSATQQNWNRLHDLLSVPLIPADIRKDFIADEARISRELNLGTKKAENLPAVEKQQAERNAEAAAQRQGRFALHMLGTQHPDYKVIDPVIAKPEGEWQKSLNRAGEDLGHDFNKIAAKLYADTDQARRKPLGDAEPLLRDAALRVRLVSGAAVTAWSPRDPVGDLRNVQMCELLRWQGERTFADYWANVDSGQPYYRDAGKLYVDAAKALASKDLPDLTAEQKSARLEDLTKLEAKLNADDKFEWRWRDGDRYVAGPAVLHFTDEEKVKRGFGLVCPPDAPDGFATVWEELEPGKSLKPANEADLERRALAGLPKKPETTGVEFTLTREPPSQSLAKVKTQYIVKGFYRGRRFSIDTAVTLHNLPELTSYQPEAPESARLWVVANQDDYERFAAANSEVVIVVDFSGSMDTTVKGTGKTRKQLALAALKTCLKKIPNGVRVSLLTYDGDKNDGGKTYIHPRWQQLEWKNKADSVDKLIDELDALKPQGGTPLVRATLEAKKYFTKDFTGAKTVIILTDGGDNQFSASDADAAMRREYKTMKNCLNAAFKDSGILVNVVGIELDQLETKEEIEGLKQYKPAIEQEGVGGLFVDLKDITKLAEQLERFLTQIHFHLEAESGNIPPGAIPDEGGDVSRSQSGARPIKGLAPGTYNIVLKGNRLQKKPIEQRFRLERGDSVVLQLVPGADGKTFRFRRQPYLESYAIEHFNNIIGGRREVKDTPWAFAVLQNQKINNLNTRKAIQMMTVIERREDKAASPKTAVQLVRPQHVWFQVTTEENPKAPVPGMRFYPLADFPGPSYSLDIVEWPQGQKARLEAWWNEDQIPDCGILRRTTGTHVTDLAPRSMEVRPTDQDEQTRIVVESIQQERRRVEVQPGVWKDDVDCLVVRLRYPVGENTSPFFVRLPEDVGEGCEHRFYTEAGKYTGIFWNVSKERADNLEFIKIYSVKGVLRKAHHLEPMALGEPNTNDRPPKP